MTQLNGSSQSIPPPPASDTPIPRPIPLTTSNGIQIQSVVFPQLAHWTDR